ncbi:MAG: DUF3137 domain-containing protein [Clostridiales bacterium]|nr:DUF3137 domain-containing protein [Clostridiales bacterium]
MNENMSMIESMRKKVMILSICMWAIPLAIVILSAVMTISSRNIDFGPLALFGGFFGSVVFVAIFHFAVYRKKLNEYRNFYKTHYVYEMVRQVIPDAIYQPEYGFPSQQISQTGLMQMGNIYKSEDYIRGTYNNVAFERSDILIQNETNDSEGHSSTTTYLRGRWMIFESNKNFEADLQIIQQGFGYARKRTSIFTKKAERRHAFKTEDAMFNKMFKCLCQNEVEAFYLLTPGLMQGLMQLASQSDGKIMIGFVDNQLHVAINSRKDHLEPPIYHSPNNDDIMQVQREINAVTSFVEGLNLDRQIFK